MLLAAAANPASAQNASIVNSPHNLSASGPGRIKSVSETEVCIFCHTPHHASPVQPLWNRQLPVSAYTIYHSNSLQAKPGQPTGASKLCLSCHDGTIALGAVLSRGQPVAFAGGVTTLPPGASNLGTDLSDDHPISFRYDAGLVTKNPKLKQPGLFPTGVHVDRNGEMQCTSCHDPHNNRFGRFLVMDNQNSQLCNACHIMGLTDVSQHTQCASCHKTHTAPSGPYLLRQAKVAETCTTCHGASGPGPNIGSQLSLTSTHETHSTVDVSNPIPKNASCSDCHDAHSVKAQGAAAPNISARLGMVSGVTAGGAPVAAARYEFEVCFKCHADQNAMTPWINRVIIQANTRLEFDPTAVSFHPVEVRGKNNDVPSLIPGMTTSTIIYCSDCHNSDTGKLAGGGGPNGVHGSTYRPLLIAQYRTQDGTAETALNYALCYRCHQRNIIISDNQSGFRFHKKHVVEQHAPCSICHVAHGVSSIQGTAAHNSRLINFDTTVVLREASTNKIEFTTLGNRHGTCTLKCHNEVHKNRQY